MGGLSDMLFGSTEGPSVSQLPTKTPEQAALLKQLTDLLSGQVGQGVPSYPGTVTAAPSGMETQSWDMIKSLLEKGVEGTGAGSKEAISKILSGTNAVPSYDVGEFDPGAIQNWYKDALVKPAMATWEKDIVPGVQEKFISQNAGSSGAANRAIAGSAEDMMTNLNSQLANTLFGEKQAFDTRKFTAGTQGTQNEFAAGQNDLSRLLNIPGMESNSLDQLFKTIGLGETAGATERGITQQGNAEEMQKWLSEQGYNNPYIKELLANVLGTGTTENVVNQGSQQSGLLQDFMPLASSYLGSASGSAGLTALLAALSSKRYKKNIVPVGQKIAGLQPVEFEYTEEAIAAHPSRTVKGRTMGFIAEEVAEKYPDAVLFDAMGRPDAINYLLLQEAIAP